MSWGIRIRDSSGNPVIDRTQTFLRYIGSVIVPFSTTTITTTYSMPAFDDAKGLFSWRAYTGYEVGVPFSSINWNNTSKILTITHHTTSPTPSDIRLAFTFFHHK